MDLIFILLGVIAACFTVLLLAQNQKTRRTTHA